MEQSKYLPLYLKHRPQSLGELVGQKSVVKTLTNAIENKRIAHAYLFTGPRGTGKTSSARILAKSLNCEQGPTVAPCLQCSSCVSIKESSCPSVFEIDAASNNSVDDARMLIERAPLVAQGGRFKLYIVDECHMLTKEAFNALLKTIEEPPSNVIFILATTEEHKVPPTILSRCQRLMFRLVNHEELAEHLASVAQKESIEIDKDALELITRKSGGGLRDALGLLDQASLLARPGEPVSQKDLLVLLGALDEDVLLTLSKGILERNGKEVLDAITGLVMQGREPALIAQEMAKHFLNLTKASYVTQAGGNADAGRFILGSSQYIEGLLEQAKLFERAELTQMVETLDELEQSLKRSTQPSMTLEIALLSICHRHDIASVKQLQERVVQLEQMVSEGDFSKARRSEPAPMRPQGHVPAAPAAPRQEPFVAPRHDAAPPPPPRNEAVPPPRNEVQQAVPQSAIQRPEVIEDDSEGMPDVVVSSVQTLPALPEPGYASNSSSDEEEEEYDAGASYSAPQAAPHSPPPAPEPAAPPPMPRIPREMQDDSGEAMPSGELEILWSELLDALHKRSIPAYSLVSMHAFPVRFETKTLTLGVQKEFFQKSIENKTNNIILAYRDLFNDEIRVLVKVVSDGSPSKSDAAPKKRTGNDGGMDSQSSMQRSSDVAHRTQAEPSAARLPQETRRPEAAEQNRIPPSTATMARPEPALEREQSPDLDEEDDRATPQNIDRYQASVNHGSIETTRESAPKPLIEDSIDSSKIQEAYKIFEGPGSRLIS